ncbi:MAG: gamma carbonic anhydrase family protein [Candidatus Thermoplasmatota archaeon]|nr:gamma carbonic anhydrase family protein [Candidatus Thermoplasmatota archaeon]
MKIGKDTYIAKSAIIIGNVFVGERCSIWENAVIRGDLNIIEIGDESNVQDCCVLHVSPEHPMKIGKGVSVGHGAIVHGAMVENDCIIGINSTVLDGVHIGKGCIIAANAVVPPDAKIPANSLAAGVPAKIIRQDEGMIEAVRKNTEIYMNLAVKYLKGEFEEDVTEQK